MPPRFKILLTLAALALLVSLGMWSRGRRAPAKVPVLVAQPASPDARPESKSATSSPPPSVQPLTTPNTPAKTSPAPVLPPPVAATAAPAVAPSLANSNPPKAATKSVDERATTEVAATRRMYMAHASLRAPELANPDSETNRRVLQTMVEKALSRQNPAP